MTGKSLSNEIDPGYLVEQGSKLWLFGVGNSICEGIIINFI